MGKEVVYLNQGHECMVDDCERVIHARKLCEMHYKRLRRHGAIGSASLERGQRRFPKGTEIERFLSFLTKTDSCWLWNGAKISSGYGLFQSNKRSVLVHRWSYEYFKGPIMPGLTVDHVCHNRDIYCPGNECSHRLCVNPAHLEAVSQQLNTKRAYKRRPWNGRKVLV